MAKLHGKSVGDTIVEFYGPIIQRNYNTAGASSPIIPTLKVMVTGTGTIQVQETQTYIPTSNPGLNAFTTEKLPDPASWINLGTTIDESSGLVTLTLTADNVFSAIRAIVTGIGTGRVMIQSEWV